MEKIIGVCSVCGKEEVRVYDVDGRKLCADCLEKEGYGICDDCGEVVALDDMTITSYGDHVCPDCLENNYVMCDDCGEYVLPHDTREVHTGSRSWETIVVCEDCLDKDNYYCCDDCGEWYDADSYGCEPTETDRYYHVCPDCISDHYFYCENCGEYHNDDDAVWDDAFDEPVCRDCYNSMVVDNKHIHAYGYKPIPKPRTHTSRPDSCNDIDELLFGIELEADKGNRWERDDAIEEIGECTDDVYMKSDSSLTNGYEIVTHPATLDYHMFDLPWREICEISKKHGFKSHDARTCGLHIHVGRYQLGNDWRERYNTIANCLLLVDRFWDTLVVFSRRKEHQLDHYAARPQIIPYRVTDNDDDIREKLWAADNHWRYQALNLDNDNTIEFRLFNGTLKRDTIIATIQFTWNLCMFAKTHTLRECLSCTWEDITQYRQFDELNAYLIDRRIAHPDTEAIDPDDVAPYVSDETDGNPDNPDGVRFPIGTQVVITHDFEGAPAGLVGTVRCLNDHNDEYRYGCVFPEYWGGHSLDGSLEPSERSHGWWVREDHLALAS